MMLSYISKSRFWTINWLDFIQACESSSKSPATLKNEYVWLITYDINTTWHNLTRWWGPCHVCLGPWSASCETHWEIWETSESQKSSAEKWGKRCWECQGCHMIHWNILKLSTNVGKSGAISHWPIDRLRARSSESPLAHVSIAHHGQNEVTTRFSLTHFLISKANSLCWLIRLSHVITSLSHFRIHQGTSYLSPSPHRLAQGEELHEGLAQRVSHAAAPRRQLFVDPLTTGAQVLWHRLRRNCFSRWISRSYRPPPKKKKNISTFYMLYTKKSMSMHIWYKCIPTSR